MYRRHAQRVWRYCLHCLRRPADAEDALQQTFLQAHRALGRGVEPVSEAAWLLTIARNVCLTRADVHRRRDRAEVTEDPLLLDELLWAEDADDGVSAEVQAAFARLPERQRQALFLREWQECSYAEIAASLGTSESAVETLLFRARRTLARELGGSRRRIGDLAGLLGWLRTAVGTTASKLAIGAAVVAATAVGTDVALSPHVSIVRPAAVTTPEQSLVRPSLAQMVATHVRRRPQRGAGAKSSSSVSRVRSGAPPPSAPAAPAAAGSGESVAPAPAAPSAPARSEPAPVPTQPTAASALPPAPVATTTTTSVTTTVASTTSAVANTVTTATGAVSSAVDSAAQTVSSTAPAAAPVVTTAAQTVDNTVQSAGTTVSNLLPGG